MNNSNKQLEFEALSLNEEPNESRRSKCYTFVDLFAGIGGFHLAFNQLGAECIFASEWDKAARKTYEKNFSLINPDLFNSGNFVGDITLIDKSTLPDFDILTAGFPCQPFSQIGKGKGFEDARGTVFYDIAEIINVKKPKAFFLENVPYLYKHDGGKTFATIHKILSKNLGYSFKYYFVRAKNHGVPQERLRIFMIGFSNPDLEIIKPEWRKRKFSLSDVFGGKVEREIGFTLRVGGKGSGINDRRNWDSYEVDGEIRRLTPKEGKKMQGFPNNFTFPVSDSQAMSQLGNSVAVPAIRDYAQQILQVLDANY